jgi:hypothetical protein
MTEETDRLLAAARALEQRCPPELGTEIAVTGSVGAGLADEYSDIELLFLGPTVPTPARVGRWLQQIGATSVSAGVEEDGVWGWGRVDGIEIDPFWGSLDRAEAEVEAITSGEVVDHARIAFAHVLLHSVTLRTKGVLDALTRRCEPYPDGLAPRLIVDALAGWKLPATRTGAVLRGDALSAVGFLRAEMARVLRIVFALNERWEPPRWKWLRSYAEDLDVAPTRLVDRVEEVVRAADLIRSCRGATELAQNVLDLLPADVDATSARRAIDLRSASLPTQPAYVETS